VNWTNGLETAKRRLILLTVALTMLASSVFGQDTLTNDSIIKMCNAKLSIGTILNAVRNQPGQYSLNVTSLIALKAQGVPDQVIEAMQAVGGQASAGAAVSASANSPAVDVTDGASEVWTLQQINDKMADTTITVAKAEIHGEHGGVLEAVAHCTNDLSLELYIAPLTPGLAFKRSGGNDTGFFRSPACAVFQVRAGSNAVVQMGSKLCDDDVNAELFFPGDAVTLARAHYSALGSLIAPGSGEDEESKRLSKAGADTSDMMAQIAGHFAPQIKTMEAIAGIIAMPEVVSANFLRIQIPFSDGEQPIIEIHPQSPVLKSYLAKCSPPSTVPLVVRDSPARSSSESGEQTVMLTSTGPVAERSTVIIAPGRGLQKYTVFYIDTRDFAEGGTLSIDILLSQSSATDGSFDLFPGNATIPTQGRPVGTLAGRYDVPKGTSTRLEYQFKTGQVFALGLEGNWASPSGAAGIVQFRASVR
jgi:hypothetical protein